MPELLNCPFCGGPARTFQYNGTTQATCAASHIECAGSDVCAPVGMWNRRSSDEQAEVVGWVDWHGGECPVSPHTTVEAKLRHGGATHVARASGLSWKHGNIHGPTMDSDIVSYRVLASPPSARDIVEQCAKAAEAYNEEHGDPADTLHHGRSIIKAIRSLAVGDEGREGWRPINTAPKDRRIEFWVPNGNDPNGGFSAIGNWVENAYFDHWDEDAGVTIYRGSWSDHTVADWGMEENNYYDDATHWRECSTSPLPTPPSRGEGE
jgi:hypothetical protein